MLINIVPIGNSKGIRIPKAILDQCDIENEVDLEVKNGKIIIEPIKRIPRNGWTESFIQMAKTGEDQLLFEDAIDLEMEAWEW
ncbi:MAG: AbrB/MazE/SpoVT family DNA-binding domain-containing protein [Spirochaetia bacterium]